MDIRVDSTKNTRTIFTNILNRRRQDKCIWGKLIEITDEFLDEDDMRILRVPLSDTNLEIKIQGADTKPFKSNIGSPPRDAVCGPFFRNLF